MLMHSPPNLHIEYTETERPFLQLSALDNASLQALGQPDAEAAASTSQMDQQILESLLSTGVSSIPRTSYQWGMHAGQPGEEATLVGMAGLHRVNTDYPEIGAIIFRSEWLGKGLGKLAWLGMTQLAFSRDAKAVQGRVLAANKRSQRSLRGVGFTQLPRPDMDTLPYGDGKQRSKVTDWMVFNPDRTDEYAPNAFASLGMKRIHESRHAYAAALAKVALEVERPSLMSRLRPKR